MSESNVSRLKTIVERAVRPVRASTSHKRNLREELLAHLSGVFEEESARLGDERAALERTELRFGDPAEVTSQFQETVPASDGFLRFWEGHPEESILRGALRFACLEGALVLIACGIAFFALGSKRPWSADELMVVVFGSAFLPFWLLGPARMFGSALVAQWMETWLHGPEPLTGWPRIGLTKLFSSAWAVLGVRIAVIAGGLCCFLLAFLKGAPRHTQGADLGALIVDGVLLAGVTAAFSVVCAWVLVQSADERRRYHEEWARLPI